MIINLHLLHFVLIKYRYIYSFISFVHVQSNDIFIRTDAIRVYIGTYYFIMNGRELRHKI